MSDFVIIPDSSFDMPKELREEYGINDFLHGLIYFPDGHSEYVDIDWEKYDPSEFYESMRDKKVNYKTAYAPYGDILATFEKNLKAGKDIICITLSAALSGTYQSCEMAKKELLEKYPERKIVCIDSLRYSMALSLLVIMAAEKRNAGFSFEETVKYVEENKNRIHQMGTMDDLFFLCKTGRITNFKAFFGTLMGINAMADFTHHGLSEVVVKVKGKKVALDAIIYYMKNTIINPSEQTIFIAHSNRLVAAETLRDMIEKEFSPKRIIIVPVGMGSGVSIGPGLCAAYYYGEEITEGLTREKEIMNRFLQERGK